MIQDEDVTKYIEYLVENDKVKLLCLMDYIKRMIILEEVKMKYEHAMVKIMYGGEQ